MSDLWDLVWGKPSIDPGELAEAIEREAAHAGLDIRTKLLIRDGAEALASYWGRERWADADTLRRLEAIRHEGLGPVKFPSIRERLMERTKPEVIRQFLRDLGSRVGQPAGLTIGGAAALMLQLELPRATEDVDVVDEVPSEVRAMHQELDRLRQLYGLRLTHFQSHFLPSGWEARLHTLGTFGRLSVAVVDVHDLFLGKLFSPRDKDLADLRVLLPQLDREVIQRRLPESCTSFFSDPVLRAHAERNWYVLTGDPLPAV